MAKIDLITLTGLTASDGSLIASGATIKFESVFKIGTTVVKAYPKIWRNRELFESGYTNIQVTNEVLPDDITLNDFTEEEFYTLTPQMLYEKVRDVLNGFYGEEIIELQIIVE
jgi:hypothetical protein